MQKFWNQTYSGNVRPVSIYQIDPHVVTVISYLLTAGRPGCLGIN